MDRFFNGIFMKFWKPKKVICFKLYNYKAEMMRYILEGVERREQN